jgi:hypothetical protein
MYHSNDYYGSGEFSKNSNMINNAQNVDFKYTKNNSDLLTQSSNTISNAYEKYMFQTPNEVKNDDTKNILYHGDLSGNTMSSDEVNPHLNYNSSAYEGDSNIDSQYNGNNQGNNLDDSKLSYSNNEVVLPSDISYTIGGSTGSNITY